MKFYAPFRKIALGYSILRTLLFVSVWSLTSSVPLSFALAWQPENSAPGAETTTSKTDLSGLNLKDSIENPSITLGALSVVKETQAPIARSTQTGTVDFSYQIMNDSISSDTKTAAEQELFTSFSLDTFTPMWMSESTGKTLLRLIQIYGPGLGIQ